MSNITITAGDDYFLKLIYKDKDGNIIDITGASAEMMVRKSYYSAPVITKVATITGAAGEILFDFDPADTDNLADLVAPLTKQTYIYDVELTELNTEVTTLQAGNFIVQQAVTRD